MGVPPPWLDPELYLVHAAHRKLGRDANGRVLLEERQVFLERRLSDAGERDAYDQLFDQLEAETSAIQLDEWEAYREQHEL